MRYGIIGNCSYSALVLDGVVSWLCWPRFDSSFVFGSLLDEQRGGSFAVTAVDVETVEQSYVENTNVLRTVFTSAHGSFELLDFAPRFRLYDRYFKPTMLLRVMRPLSGEPRVRVSCEPTYEYGQLRATTSAGSNHLQYHGLGASLRLTTNLPLTYVQEGRAFVLDGERHLALTWGEPLEAELEQTARGFLDKTIAYWRRWVKHMRVPRDYQREVIRSALVLKLHQFEDTGAIIAATTTSLPEYPGSGRNWDYRYCWLRDAYFSLNAFERLGHADEMERFLAYLRNICLSAGADLQPLYAINGATELAERELDHLAGYGGERPVRVGNQAHEHVQNDVYGEMILAISRLLIDSRFVGVEGRDSAMRLVGRLLGQIEARMEQPDAGLWELRSQSQLHSFTLLMHWAGARRAAEIAEAVGDEQLHARARAAEARSRHVLETRCWNAGVGALTQAADQPNLDAAMLLVMHFGFFRADDPRAATHVEAIRNELQIGRLLRRYDVLDDFGEQRAAFTVCSFWLVEALALIGRKDEARELFEHLLSLHNGLGLFAEDILPATGAQSGNFPQTYSHVGLINAAFRLSRPWY